MIKAVFFDVGGVLLKNEIEVFYKALSKELDINYDGLMEIHKKYKNDLLSGKLTVREFSGKIEEEFGINSRYDALWKDAYLKTMALNEDVFRIAENLKQNYVVGIISNSMEAFDEINHDRKVYHNFSPVVLSCKHGVAKPQKEIFEIASKEARLKAENCVFIDDRENLLETPRKMGFYTIQYKTPSQLEKDLRKLKLVF